MPFCPFFSTNCPESYEGDTGCAIWTHFGCCMIDKPGIPAIYQCDTDDAIDVFIMHISRSVPAPLQKFDVIFARADTGKICIDNDITKFCAHLIHHPNQRG